MRRLLIAISFLIITGCAVTPAPHSDPNSKTALEAWRNARATILEWDHDAKILKIASPLIRNGVPVHNGTLSAWDIYALSDAKRQVGVFAYHGISDQTQRVLTEDFISYDVIPDVPMDFGMLKSWAIDSPRALEIGRASGGNTVLETSPDTEIRYSLSWSHDVGQLVWHISFGSEYTAYINANTGDIVQGNDSAT